MSDLVKRLREYGDAPQDVSHGEIAEWMHKAAEKIYELDKELSWQLGNVKMYRDQLAAEKALADRMYDDWRCGENTNESSAVQTYRKARGL